MGLRMERVQRWPPKGVLVNFCSELRSLPQSRRQLSLTNWRRRRGTPLTRPPTQPSRALPQRNRARPRIGGRHARAPTAGECRGPRSLTPQRSRRLWEPAKGGPEPAPSIAPWTGCSWWGAGRSEPRRRRERLKVYFFHIGLIVETELVVATQVIRRTRLERELLLTAQSGHQVRGQGTSLPSDPGFEAQRANQQSNRRAAR